MSPDELDAVWQGLRTPETREQLEAARLPGSDTWAAIDHEGQRHLLLRVPGNSEVPPAATRGLAVIVARHQVAGGEPADYIDLRCMSEDEFETFTAVGADIATRAGPAEEGDRLAIVGESLSRWQWFWDVEPDRLGERDALGLFAEMWYLRRWEHARPEAVAAWTASAGARHDFQWPDRSVEVKGTTRRADGAVLHRIQHLDQLADPEEGELFLFSLVVARDELAHNSLSSLIDQLESALSGSGPLHEDFLRKLGARGWSPAFRHRHDVPYRVLSEALYAVSDGFPRLVDSTFQGGLPQGVTSVSYVIDMEVCEPWLVARNPEERG